MARISINEIVAETIRPWLDQRALHRTVDLGHDTPFFRTHRRDEGPRTPLRVAYTTWKSDVGDRVAAALVDDPGFAFRAITTTATWAELRELYQWSDVFLATPGPEEGLYLPGLEAMAAESVVVTPDVGGNMAYCRPGLNCVLVDYDDAGSYVAALRGLASSAPREVLRLRRAGAQIVDRFDLSAERAGFAAFLAELEPRIVDFERSGRRRWT
nr:glycosyltransferase [Nocardioides perillae]